MARQMKSKITRLITWVLVLLLLVGGIGAILHFSGVKKDDIIDIFNPVFRIEYDGKVYKADTENISDLSKNGQAVFKIKNGGQYSVKITPYTSCNFTLNGEKRVLDKSEDITEFIIDNSEVTPEYFIVNCGNYFLLQKAIKEMCGSSGNYVFSGNANDFCLNLFITSESGEIVKVKVTQFGVMLDRYNIIL